MHQETIGMSNETVSIKTRTITYRPRYGADIVVLDIIESDCEIIDRAIELRVLDGYYSIEFEKSPHGPYHYVSPEVKAALVEQIGETNETLEMMRG